jgi:drug/metabolite transporter (DMT)-like permease
VTAAAAGRQGRSLALAAMPAIFVFLWSTGFIGAKFGLPYIEPLTFLCLRFAIVLALLLSLALAVGAPWPGSWREAGHMAVAGVLLHAAYLGGVFASIAQGVDAGVSALIVGCSPCSRRRSQGRCWANG